MAHRLGLARGEAEASSPDGESRGLPTFQEALEALRPAPRATRLLALRGALEVALEAGTLGLGHNLALRTVVDALGLRPSDLADLFRQRTGTEPPPPWDPSRRGAWAGREVLGPGPAGPWDDAVPTPDPLPAGGPGAMARIKALAMLGLDEEAAPAEIRRAYLRLSRVHHPDHYLPQGAQAVQEADRAFRRIKDAYEFLTGEEP
ncbi:MAG TPA: J domain-containing protein [Holophagaceae bacterium]